MKRVPALKTILLSSAALALPYTLTLVPRAASSESRGGYVYTLNNDPTANGVVALKRQADGSLREVAGSPFLTGGKGLALRSAGEEIDEQGAVRIHEGHVLAVNPGSNSISVFDIKSDGGLKPVPGSPFASGGDHPISLAISGELVYVANQAMPFGNPTAPPNITGFRMMANGSLRPIPGSTRTFPAGAGPAQVEFSPKGGLLAVTSGFQTAESSRVSTYKVLDDGTLVEGPGSPAAAVGASGTVGFSWDRKKDRLYVSNFRGSSITVWEVDRTSGGIKQKGAPIGNGETAACWTALSPDGKTLYVANFVSNTISAFDVREDGALRLLGSTPRRGSAGPDTKDIEVSADGKWLYAIGTRNRQVSVFSIGADRLAREIAEAQSPFTLSSGQFTTGLAAN